MRRGGRAARSVSSDRVRADRAGLDTERERTSSLQRRSPRDHLPSTRSPFQSRKKLTPEAAPNSEPSTPGRTAELTPTSPLSPLPLESLSPLPSTPGSLAYSFTDSLLSIQSQATLSPYSINPAIIISQEPADQFSELNTSETQQTHENKLSTSDMAGVEGDIVEPVGTTTALKLEDEVFRKVQLVTTACMPGPKDRKAPRFRGKHVLDFATTLEDLAITCGITQEELPGYVLRYCSREVRNVLINDDEFKGRDWSSARARLIYLYESQTPKFKVSARKLRRFVKKHKKSRLIKNRKTLDEYRNKFILLLGDLVERKEFAENEANNLFFWGLPYRVRNAIGPMLVNDREEGYKITKSMPPSIDAALRAARAYYSSDDINRFDSDGSDEDGENSDTDSDADSEAGESLSGSDTDSSGHSLEKRRKKKKLNKKKKSRRDSYNSEDSSDESEREKKKKKAKGKKKANKIEDIEARLTRKMDELTTRLLADRQPSVVAALPPQTNIYPPVAGVYSAVGASMGWSQDRKCYICGKADGQGLNHRFGVKSCPETERLVRDGLLKFSPVDGRMVRPDGRELPRLQDLQNGLAAFLRAETQMAAPAAGGGVWPGRDAPPHQSASGVRECMMIGLYKDDEPVVGSDKYTVTSFAGAYDAMPAVTRSKGKEVNRSARIEEISDDEGPTRNTTPKVVSDKIPILGTSGRDVSTNKYPVHPANTEDAWRAAQKARGKDRAPNDTEKVAGVESSPFRSTTKNPVRFTSNLQESVDVEAIQNQILETKLTMSLRDVLAMSPHLQKRLGSLVKTRREFETHTSKVGAVECFEGEASDRHSASLPGMALQMTFDRSEDLGHLLERYADVIVVQRTRLFAMASGLVEVVFGNRRATFLVDTGSELNLVSRSLWEATSVPVDKDGSRWSLKGLGGEDVPLLGCCLNAPVQLGGKNFDHHFFVCSSDKGRHDGILGQPWFEWFSASIEYSRGGSVTLQVFASGDREGAHVKVPIVRAEDPRNSEKLVMTSQLAVGSYFQ